MESIWWKLFQKRVVYFKLDIYVFIRKKKTRHDNKIHHHQDLIFPFQCISKLCRFQLKTLSIAGYTILSVGTSWHSCFGWSSCCLCCVALFCYVLFLFLCFNACDLLCVCWHRNLQFPDNAINITTNVLLPGLRWP